MKQYLLDTNVIIILWRQYYFVMDKLIKDEKIKILKEVSQELVVKEKRMYKREVALSERFCNLFPFIIEVNKEEIEKFYSMINIKYSMNGNAYIASRNKLSENDLLLLYACYLDDNLILVTEDNYLFNAANYILDKDRVIKLELLINNTIKKELL